MHALVVFLNGLLNAVFGAPLGAVLQAMGIHPANPAAPINATFTLELLTAALLLAFFLAVRFTLNVERPNPLQHVAEMIDDFVVDQADAIIGHGYEAHIPFVTMIFLFIVICNCYGLLPGVETPTADPVVPLGIALPTFFYYNFVGLRAQGAWGYAKHFMGPVWWLIPLMLPVEIISHLARNLSLTVRLYANMLASDLLALVFFSIFPLFALPFLGLHFGVALIQAYVFMLLALIYLAGAMEHEEAVD